MNTYMTVTRAMNLTVCHTSTRRMSDPGRTALGVGIDLLTNHATSISPGSSSVLPRPRAEERENNKGKHVELGEHHRCHCCIFEYMLSTIHHPCQVENKQPQSRDPSPIHRRRRVHEKRSHQMREID